MPDYSEAIPGARQSDAGWLDGEGSATDPPTESCARELLHALEALGAPCPYVYPTEEGGFSFEWDLPGKSIGMKVNPLVDPDPDGEPAGFFCIVVDLPT